MMMMMKHEADEEQLSDGIVNESNSNFNGNGGDGDCNVSDDVEQQKLSLLRTCVESRDPSSKVKPLSFQFLYVIYWFFIHGK